MNKMWQVLILGHFRLPTVCVYRAVLLHLKDTYRLALQQGEGLPSIENDDDVAARKLMAQARPALAVDETAPDYGTRRTDVGLWYFGHTGHICVHENRRSVKIPSASAAFLVKALRELRFSCAKVKGNSRKLLDLFVCIAKTPQAEKRKGGQKSRGFGCSRWPQGPAARKLVPHPMSGHNKAFAPIGRASPPGG